MSSFMIQIRGNWFALWAETATLATLSDVRGPACPQGPSAPLPSGQVTPEVSGLCPLVLLPPLLQPAVRGSPPPFNPGRVQAHRGLAVSPPSWGSSLFPLLLSAVCPGPLISCLHVAGDAPGPSFILLAGPQVSTPHVGSDPQLAM